MLFLICNIVFASSFTLCIKWIHVRSREDVISVGAINYIVAFLVMVPIVMISGNTNISREAMRIGGSMGFCYFIAFFFVIYAIQWVGASGATVISVLSIVVPIIVGIFIWDEKPNRMQAVGIVMALFSLLLIGTRHQEGANPLSSSHRGYQALILFVFFGLCGYARLAQSAYRHVCEGQPSDHFTFASFLVATIPSLGLLVYRGKRLRFSECMFGFAMGLANALQTQFIILSLKYFDSFVTFPVTSAGALMLTTLIATQFLNERLTKRAYVGIVLACVALVLLNWKLGTVT